MKIEIDTDIGRGNFPLCDGIITLMENLDNKQILKYFWNQILCRLSDGVKSGDLTLNDLYQQASMVGDQLIKDLAKSFQNDS